MKQLPSYFDSMIDLLTEYVEKRVDHFTLQTYIDGAYEGPYVQALQEHENILLIEAVSNEYLQPPLEEAGHQTLLFMRWRFYPESYLPNYTQFINQAITTPREVAVKLVQALHFAYGVDDTYLYEIGPELEGHKGRYRKIGAVNEYKS
jgi:hypothetical protein